ncbi:nli interacting factor-like phosphatase family protein [Stylonychia lemnae]|uniref:Nli interacting factor-like phosphatase family protein n=1 Tax=Stylonychia lemnae TaxID=5949 RepID=A0A077ZVU7_STYLE|nr:nli interacting factor-like phosphatase family protein [Stylonychia lemnae]|eukprot:CDW72561.1 nli interacting factor-like phosphatase family protein [Stylonychia lemnae]
MNNYNISNSSGGGSSQKSSRYYGLPQTGQTHLSASPQNDQSRPHKIQVLKPIINYRHNANKVIGVDMSQEEYFFYKPILGGRKIQAKENYQSENQQQSQQPPSMQQYSKQSLIGLNKKESYGGSSNSTNSNHQSTAQQSKETPHHSSKFHMHQMNSNHLMSPKSVITNSLLQNQKSQNYSQANEGIASQKRSQIQNYSSNSQPLTQRYMGSDENSKNESYSGNHYRTKLSTIEDSGISDFKSISNLVNFESLIIIQSPTNGQSRQTLDGRLSQGRVSQSRESHNNVSQNTGDMTSDSQGNNIKSSLIAFENHKQFSNNPLKDISNQVSNNSNSHHHSSKSKNSQQNFNIGGSTSSRHSLPFQIAPSSIKINNYLDQPFKQITPSIKTNDKDSGLPFQLSSGSNSKFTDKNGAKISSFDEQNRYSSKLQTHQSNSSQSGHQQKSYFEKKRLSDNALDDKYRMEEDVIKDIFEKKEKTRKGHNASVTTNTSTTSNNTNKKLGSYGQLGHNQNPHTQSTIHVSRKSQLGSKNSTPSNGTATPNVFAQQISSFKIIENQDRVITNVMEQIKRKQKGSFSLKETAKSIKELNKSIQAQSNDSSFLSLLRQHTRTHFVSLAFVKALDEDLTGLNRTTDNLQAIVLNALEYVKKNFKCLNDILLNASITSNGNKSNKNGKKDLNSNPFGVGGSGAVTTRNSNKENYGSTQNSNKNAGSKSEKKMFIKQNIQISLAFLKKICRISKTYQDKFKEFQQILNNIETGAQTTKVKDQIKRALQQIRIEQKAQIQHTQSQANINSTNSPRKSSLTTTSRKSRKRENITIDIDEDQTQLQTTNNYHFGGQFSELKEHEHEESMEDNKSSDKHQSAQKVDTDPFIQGEIDEERKDEKEKTFSHLFGNKENSAPNFIDKPGRYSLQPQPLGLIKLNNEQSQNTVVPKTVDEEKPCIKVYQSAKQAQADKENIAADKENTQQPQLSIVTKKHATKISNTHEPITVRGQRTNPRFNLNEESNGLQYCFAPPHINNRSSSLPSKEPYLPQDVTRGLDYTLVLDLDETLVHFDPRIRTYRPRPFCLKFLHEMSKYYELVVFTAGLKDYADWILNDLDRSCYISHRLYRDHTKCRSGVYIKDLSKIGRDLTKTIIIDNIEENFQAQPDNGIPIKGWYHDSSDRELERYAMFLRDIALKRVQDVRPEVRQFKYKLNLSSSVIEGSPNSSRHPQKHGNNERPSGTNNQQMHRRVGNQQNNLQPWGVR